MTFEFRDDAHKAAVLSLYQATESGDGCQIAKQILEQSPLQKLRSLQDLQMYRDDIAGKNDSLPPLDIVVSQNRDGAGGATVFQNKGVILEMDWGAAGKLRSGTCLAGDSPKK